MKIEIMETKAKYKNGDNVYFLDISLQQIYYGEITVTGYDTLESRFHYNIETTKNRNIYNVYENKNGKTINDVIKKGEDLIQEKIEKLILKKSYLIINTKDKFPREYNIELRETKLNNIISEKK